MEAFAGILINSLSGNRSDDRPQFLMRQSGAIRRVIKLSIALTSTSALKLYSIEVVKAACSRLEVNFLPTTSAF